MSDELQNHFVFEGEVRKSEQRESGYHPDRMYACLWVENDGSTIEVQYQGTGNEDAQAKVDACPIGTLVRVTGKLNGRYRNKRPVGFYLNHILVHDIEVLEEAE